MGCVPKRYDRLEPQNVTLFGIRIFADVMKFPSLPEIVLH